MESITCKNCGLNFVDIKKKGKKRYLCCKICGRIIIELHLNELTYFEEYVSRNNNIVYLLNSNYLRDIDTNTVLINNCGDAFNEYEGVYFVRDEIIEYHDSFKPITREEYLNGLESYSDEICDSIKIYRKDLKKIMTYLDSKEDSKEIKDMLEVVIGWWGKYHNK